MREIAITEREQALTVREAFAPSFKLKTNLTVRKKVENSTGLTERDKIEP